MAVPLTKFNGVEKQTDDPAKPDPISGRNPTALATLERGDETPISLSKRNLWHYDFDFRRAQRSLPLADATTPPHIFKVQLQHTLGYINKAYDPTPYNSTNAPGSPFDGAVKFYAGCAQRRAIPVACLEQSAFFQFGRTDARPSVPIKSIGKGVSANDSITVAVNEFKQDTSNTITLAGNNCHAEISLRLLAQFLLRVKTQRSRFAGCSQFCSNS